MLTHRKGSSYAAVVLESYGGVIEHCSHSVTNEVPWRKSKVNVVFHVSY